MANQRPKVSIIIPVYRGDPFLREAINSALAQTYENTELIVINDGSDDDGATERIALAYGSKIRYFWKENGGVASALNLGIEKMSGEYFSWLSHDDLYYPQKIEEQVASILDDPECNTISVCNVTVIDEKGQRLGANIMSERANRSMKCFLATDTETGVNGCAVLIPKRLFLKNGLFDENLKASQDYDLWFKFADHARFVLLDDELVFSRRHDKQSGKTMGILPTLEADQLHSSMLARIELAEMREFVGEDLDYLGHAYSVYKNAGYHKTAARLLAWLIRLHVEIGDYEAASTLLEDRFLGTSHTPRNQGKEIINSLFTQVLPNGKPIILVYCDVWVRGGIERVFSILFEELSRTYNFVLVSKASADPVEGFPLPEQVCHIEMRPELVSELPYCLLSLAALTRASLVIANPNIMTEVLRVYPVMKACGVKTIACNHYNYFLGTWSSWLYPMMAERLALLRDATVAVWLTSFSASAYGLHNSNGALIPNPNVFETQDEFVFHAGRATILCVGRFCDHIKRMDRMLRVFKLVLNRVPSAQLILVGGYDLDLGYPGSANSTYRELIAQLSFPEGAVLFEGEQSDTSNYYKRASVLMLTSDLEGFSLVLIEAGSHGVPCVLFEVPGLEDLITDAVNGYVVPQDDLEGMAERIGQLLTDHELRRTMGHNAWTMSKRFDRKVVSDRWAHLIDSVISTEEKEELEECLGNAFREAPADWEGFTRTLAREYEKGLTTVIRAGYTKEGTTSLVDGVGASGGTPLGSGSSEGPVASKGGGRGLIRKIFLYARRNGIRRTLRRILEKLEVYG